MKSATSVGPKLITLSSRLRAGKLQHLLNHVRQTPAFAVDDIAVLRDLFWTVDDAIGEILTCRTDYRERRAQFVSYPGNEIDLLAGQDAPHVWLRWPSLKYLPRAATECRS